MEFNKVIQERHSVRKFKAKEPDWRDIIEAIDSARYAPMAGNNFSLKFILVNEKEKLKRLAEATQQPFVEDVKYILVVCTVPSRTTLAYEERAQRYLPQQAGAAIQNILLKITDMGLSTCWVGHFVDTIVKETLSISEDVTVEALLPIGYEFKKLTTRKAKIDMDNILYFNKYKNKRLVPPRKPYV